MSRTDTPHSAWLRIGAGNLIALCAASLLSACVVQTRAYVPPPPPPPPPPRVYVAPPVVEVAAPGVAVEVTATEPPPPLPDYEQPPCPDDGYLWTPGYWHYGYAGYYWVPGTWVQPPQVGVLWTPGYWGFAAGVYGFHAGYWGPHIGFYGGVNYGFGYGGVGFVGGRWEGNRYAYNTAVNNVSNTTTIHNTYNQTVINNVTVNKVSYNGGAGGVAATPTAQEKAAAQESHIPPTAAQSAHVQQAARNPALAAKANGGHPAIAATARPGAFSGPGVVGAHGAAPLATSTKPPVNQMNTAHTPPANAAHPPALANKPAVVPKTQLAKVPPKKPPVPPANGAKEDKGAESGDKH